VAPPGLMPGPDGRPRCWWAVGSPEYTVYHDEEWGRPVTDDRGLYEKLTLEAFQSGLSWLTILRKRDGFRAAFAGFELEAVDGFGNDGVERLLGDARIVRNRAKIEAAIANAGAVLAMREAGESLADLMWSFRPAARRKAPRTPDDLPTAFTPESEALSKELKRRGFRFVGPTTVYSTMQACGLVNDHLAGCAARAETERQQARARRGFPARS
jgi:DNA-3-methyladenine glycosylase I